MDVLALIGIIWRHRLASLVMAIFVMASSAGVWVVSPPGWSGTSSFLLIEPAPPAEGSDANSPEVDNPFSRYGNPGVIIDVLSRRVDAQVSQGNLLAGREVTEYEIAPSNRYGAASPILDVKVTAQQQAQVFDTLNELGGLVTAQLAQLQSDEGVSATRNTYTIRQVDQPEQLTRELSSTLRLMVGVAGLGMLALLTALSVLEGLARRRTVASDAASGPAEPDRDNRTADPDADSTSGPPTLSNISQSWRTSESKRQSRDIA